MVLYKNTKVKVCSSDGNTDLFDIVAGMQQGDTLASYHSIICLEYILWRSIDQMKENTLERARSRRCSTRTITDEVYVNDILLLANTSAKDESLLHCLERAADGIGLHENADKTEYMYFNQSDNIFTSG